MIGQSVAILRYLVGLSGTLQDDPFKAAKTDSALKGAQEMFARLNSTLNFAIGETYHKNALEMPGALASKIEGLERLLGA